MKTVIETGIGLFSRIVITCICDHHFKHDFAEFIFALSTCQKVSRNLISQIWGKVAKINVTKISSAKLSTLIGETFARETFARWKTREIFWINFRESKISKIFARLTFANEEFFCDNFGYFTRERALLLHKSCLKSLT